MFLDQLQLVREIGYISRITVAVAGLPASDHDSRQFHTVTLMRYGLEADLCGLSCIGECSYRRIIHGIKSVDLRSYAEDYKYLKQEYLLSIQANPRDYPWHCFKRSVAAKIHYKWILEAMAKFYPTPGACLQWLAFDERLLLDTNSDISQEIEAYVSFERELSGRVYPADTCELLSGIISDWLAGFSLGEQPPDPCFGPGSVADMKGRVPQLEKAHHMVYDESTVRTLCEYWYCTVDELMVGQPGTATWTNKIIFRPKNALKHRIISAEPCWLSWLQQAIKRPLYDYVENHPRMNSWFSNQDHSRKLALQGSIDGSYATFDFSNASDAITAELVSQLFGDTYILEPLFLTRSTDALMPDGQLVHLNKFAPMGSATCFATMDIIILSICELAIRQSLGRQGNRSDYVVYGDDAIIRVEAAEAFSQLSRSLGMTINEDKSYWRPDTHRFYRESCGIEALDGVDITPYRYSRFQEPLVGGDPTSEQYVASAISLMNRALVDYAYYETRSVVIEVFKHAITQCKSPRKRRLAQTIWDRLLRVDYSDYEEGFDGPFAVVVPDGTATNYRCPQRSADHGDLSSPWYQRFEVKATCRRKSLRNPHDAGWDETLLHLWYFKASTDRPTRADDLPEWWEPLEEGSTPNGGSLVGAAMGIQSQRWDWTWVWAKA